MGTGLAGPRRRRAGRLARRRAGRQRGLADPVRRAQRAALRQRAALGVAPPRRALAHERAARRAGGLVSDAPQIRLRDAPPRIVWALEQAGVHPLLARLYAARGVRAVDELDDALAKLLPPSGLL